jgi:hypothetical protein
MKKIGLCIMILLGSMGIFGHAPGNNSAQEEITWFGLDYSLVKFIGLSSDFSDLENIRTHYFRSWNELIQMESDKYDIRGAFGVSEVSYEMEFAIARSEKRDMGDILQTDSYIIDSRQLASVITTYTNHSVDRVGALFIMETLNKIQEESTMWLAVFNIATGEIIHIKRYTGKPGGFGFRNYWARSYYNVLKSLKESPRKPF